MQKAGEGATVDNDLGLDIVSSDNVAHSPEGGADDRLLVVHQELHYSPADPAVYDGLDLVIGSVAQVGQSPAGVRQHVRVVVEEEPAEDRQGRGYLRWWRGLEINNDNTQENQ